MSAINRRHQTNHYISSFSDGTSTSITLLHRSWSTAASIEKLRHYPCNVISATGLEQANIIRYANIPLDQLEFSLPHHLPITRTVRGMPTISPLITSHSSINKRSSGRSLRRYPLPQIRIQSYPIFNKSPETPSLVRWQSTKTFSILRLIHLAKVLMLRHLSVMMAHSSGRSLASDKSSVSGRRRSWCMTVHLMF